MKIKDMVAALTVGSPKTAPVPLCAHPGCNLPAEMHEVPDESQWTSMVDTWEKLKAEMEYKDAYLHKWNTNKLVANKLIEGKDYASVPLDVDADSVKVTMSVVASDKTMVLGDWVCQCAHLARAHCQLFAPSGDAVLRCVECDCPDLLKVVQIPSFEFGHGYPACHSVGFSWGFNEPENTVDAGWLNRIWVRCATCGRLMFETMVKAPAFTDFDHPGTDARPGSWTLTGRLPIAHKSPLKNAIQFNKNFLSPPSTQQFTQEWHHTWADGEHYAKQVLLTQESVQTFQHKIGLSMLTTPEFKKWSNIKFTDTSTDKEADE